jgi:N6-L-threonylcarbamoyladenine synthase
VEREALKGDPEAFDFPRPMLGRPEPDFSLSGLKTAVRLAAERVAPLSDQAVRDLCASFQAAVVDVLVERTRVGLRAFRSAHGLPSCLVVAGGVAANQSIRRGLVRLATEAGLKLVAPPPALCGDNGAMIAWAGLERLRLGLIDGLDAPPRPRWPLEAKIHPAPPTPGEPPSPDAPAGILA